MYVVIGAGFGGLCIWRAVAGAPWEFVLYGVGCIACGWMADGAREHYRRL